MKTKKVSKNEYMQASRNQKCQERRPSCDENISSMHKPPSCFLPFPLLTDNYLSNSSTYSEVYLQSIQARAVHKMTKVRKNGKDISNLSNSVERQIQEEIDLCLSKLQQKRDRTYINNSQNVGRYDHLQQARKKQQKNILKSWLSNLECQDVTYFELLFDFFLPKLVSFLFLAFFLLVCVVI